MSGLVAASVAAAAVPSTAWARTPVPMAAAATMHTAVAADTTSVLGLEGADGKAAEALTAALRKAFATRGYGGGEELSLAELRLSMGCEGNDLSCLAEGGEALGVQYLVFGALTPSGGEYTVDLQILRVDEAGIFKEVHGTRVDKGDLAPDRIDATATEIVNAMFPSEDDELPDATAGVVPETGPEESVDDKPPRDSPYEWGPYRPRPKWKKVGLGVSAAFMVAGLTTGIVFGLPASQSRRKRGALYDELLTAANNSLTDDNPVNDVNPETVDDLCSDQPGSGGALEEISPEGMGAQTGIRNREVAKVCQKGKGYAIAGTIGWSVFALATASTITFATLMFVRKKGDEGEPPSDDDTVWRRHEIRLGAMPTRNGGMLSGGFRF